MIPNIRKEGSFYDVQKTSINRVADPVGSEHGFDLVCEYG
jgi:hypothetical protein